MQPVRRQMMLILDKSKSYAKKLADQLGLDPKIAQFHLSVLEKNDLIEGEIGVEAHPSGRPVGVKYFKLTKDGRELIDFVRKMTRPT
jgi:predicted ArsR family transcriptional regulator